MKRRSAAAVLGMRRKMMGEAPQALWTARPFPIFVFDDSHLGNLIPYIRQHNRDAGLEDDPYDWIEPV